MSQVAPSLMLLQRCRRSLRGKSLGLGLLVCLGLIVGTALGPAYANPPVPFEPGDLVIGLGSSPDGSSRSALSHYSSSGELLETLFTMSGSLEETGACFDNSMNLFTTNFEANSISEFGADGSLLQAGLTTNLNQSPNSCVFDAAGHLYVGLSDKDGHFGGGGTVKLNASSGVIVAVAPTCRNAGSARARGYSAVPGRGRW